MPTPSPGLPGQPYDPKLARLLAGFCQFAMDRYEKPETPTPMLVDGTMLGALTADLKGHQEEIAYFMQPTAIGDMAEDNAGVLVFRGSASLMDWLADVTAEQTKWSLIDTKGAVVLVHFGIDAIFESLCQQMMTMLRKFVADFPQAPLYVTGHSLGGGLATEAALEIALSGLADPITYTFAAPRVGDPAFAQLFDSQVPTCWRIANAYDIVPHLPPETFYSPLDASFLHYTHVDSVVHLGFFKGSVEANHALANYVEALG